MDAYRDAPQEEPVKERDVSFAYILCLPMMRMARGLVVADTATTTSTRTVQSFEA